MGLDRTELQALAAGYARPPLVGAIGSHSAIDIADGAVAEGFRTLLLCQTGRELTYRRYFRCVRDASGQPRRGCVDDVWSYAQFSDTLADAVQSKLRSRSVLLVPNRALSSYLPIEAIEDRLRVPLLGSRRLLRIEERSERENYYSLLSAGGLPAPEAVAGPEAIDGLVMVKLPHAVRRLERGFFTCSSPAEYAERSGRLIASGVIRAEDLAGARIERYVVGPVFNFNFFYSPLAPREEALELLGVDERRESSLDGLVRLPAAQQLSLPEREQLPRYTVVGHGSLTVRESILEEVFHLGERFADIARERYSPGVIGPFCLQTCIDAEGRPVIFDVAVRIGGGTNIHLALGHPYANALWREPMSSGRRLARELRNAIAEERLAEVLT